MPEYMITPWRSQQDLLDVRRQLYRLDTDASDERKYAVGRVSAWKLRGHLPHAVESTALLVDAFLHHDILGVSSMSIAATYSAAFTRFVTGFCDIGRNRERSLEPSSMLSIARQIDMPEGFVALRHEATHEEVPSIQRLVPACEEALQWLWRVYWSQLDQRELQHKRQPTSVGSDRSEACIAAARKAFKDYRSIRRDLIRKKGSVQQLEQRATEVAQDALNGCDQEEVLRAVTDDIIAKDWLLPSDQEAGRSLDGAFLFWDAFLYKLSETNNQFYQALSASMLDLLKVSTGGSAASRKQAYTQWLSHILCSEDWNSRNASQDIEVRRSAIKDCLLWPNHWTNVVAKDLLTTGHEVWQEEWSELVSASILSGDDHDGRPVAEQDNVSRSEAMTSSEPNWYKAPLASRVPIGIVAG